MLVLLSLKIDKTAIFCYHDIVTKIESSGRFMNLVYNTFDSLSSSLSNFFLSFSPHISKPQAKNLSYIILASIDANSIITSSVASHFKGGLSYNKPESNERRIRRFLNNPHFDIYSFFDDLISYVIDQYKVKYSDNIVFVCMDHSFNNDDFTTLTLTTRIGRQSIPIYFRCFEGTNDSHAFSFDTIKNPLTFAHKLFPNYQVIFLADRFFNDPSIFQLIEDLSDFYCIRTKTNINVSIDSISFVPLSSIKPYVYKSKLLENIYFSFSKKHLVNIAISPSKDTDDPWYIVTNLPPKKALKYYSYRFGGIEFFFKSQKSNGFYLEKTTTRSLQVFKNLFGITCISILWLTILGVDYCKNKSHSKVNFYDVKIIHGKPTRFKSFFRLGKEILSYAYNSCINIKIKTNFILYDV